MFWKWFSLQFEQVPNSHLVSLHWFHEKIQDPIGQRSRDSGLFFPVLREAQSQVSL